MICAERLLAIVRLPAPDDEVAEALVAGGLRAVEVSLVSADALATITRWGERYAGTLVIGAGTVLNRDEAERALDAGARYLVSPGYDEGVDAAARAAGILYVPGVFTPTELQRMLAAEIALVKLFPAGRLGPGYVRDLLAPFPRARLLATGGIDEGNARAFLEAGVAAVAVGGSLVRPGRTPAELSAAAAALRNALAPTAQGGQHDAS